MAGKKQVAPYGSWKSPITSDLIVSDAVGLGQIEIDGDDIYWLEMRPSEGGRIVAVRRTPDGTTTDVTPAPFNVRTRVHEYGGGAMAVSDGVVYFSNFSDQRLYRQRAGSEPQPVTPETDMRYADGVIDKRRGIMFCVREDHTSPWQEAVNTLATIDLSGGGSRVIVSGNNFYSSPRLSPDGSRLAWIAWNHPNMPWDGTEVWVGELNQDGSIRDRKRVAGNADESILHPEWSPDGALHFVSDRTGWWNIYRWRDGQVEPVYEMEAEFASPPWTFGISTYGFDGPNRIVCAYNKQGAWRFGIIDADAGELETIDMPYTDISRVGLRMRSGSVIFGSGSPTEPTSIVKLDLATKQTEVLRRSSEVTVDEGFISTPHAIEFPTENGLTAHAFFYPPKNRDYTGPSDEKPPLLVISHGGPTGAASVTLSMSVQYWTSKGIGVLDVNYGGSTGYGTEYRRRLNGRWGIVDIDDCVNGARYLVERGDADGDRLMIRGGSAGGYTTLAALAFRDVFKAGASYYGVSDLEALAKETHKFESRYLDSMIGPYPERQDLYIERSPIHHTDGFSCPIILFQGLEDKVVLPNQAETMLDALRKKGIPVAYIPFEGEQHGFRKAENIKRSLDAELYFYSRVFGFELAEPVEPVEIENI